MEKKNQYQNKAEKKKDTRTTLYTSKISDWFYIYSLIYKTQISFFS